jgi:hypothetical protein
MIGRSQQVLIFWDGGSNKTHKYSATAVSVGLLCLFILKRLETHTCSMLLNPQYKSNKQINYADLQE